MVAAHALLRQRRRVLRRSGTRPRGTSPDRGLLVRLARRARAWRQALLLVQPAPLWRGQRPRVRGCWRWQSRTPSRARPPTVAAAAIARIRGALLQRASRVATWAVQQDLRTARPSRRVGQPWATFLRHHAHEVWACAFLPVTDARFRSLDACVVIARGSRRVVPVGVTRRPSATWVAQHWRQATPCGQHPR